MGEVLQVKAIRPKKLRVAEVRKELLAAAEEEGKISAKELEKTVRNFRGAKPRFDTLIDVGASEVVVLVDTMTQVHNCSRAAAKLGWEADCQERGDRFELTLRR